MRRPGGMLALAIITLMAPAAAAKPRTGRPGDVDPEDRGVRVMLSADAGALIGFGFEDFSNNFAGGLTARFTWPLNRYVDLGLRQTLHITQVPYGNYDGEPIVGERSPLNPTYLVEDLTFLPSSCLALTLLPDAAVEVHMSTGVGLLAASKLRVYSFFPRVVGGLGVDVIAYRGKEVDLRIGVEADVMLAPGQSFLLPRAGVAVRF